MLKANTVIAKNGIGSRAENTNPTTASIPAYRSEVVVAGTDDAGDEGQGDDDVQPLLDHFAVDTGHLDQHEASSEPGMSSQTPSTQRSHPPPEVLVEHQVVRVVKENREEHRQTQPHHQHEAMEVLRPLSMVMVRVEQEDQRDPPRCRSW